MAGGGTLREVLTAPGVIADFMGQTPTVPDLRGEGSWTPLSEGRRRLDRFVSPHVGIVQRTFAQLRDHDEAAVAAVGARATDARFLLGAPCNELNGGGHPLPEQARAAAVGETVERYSVAWRDPDLLVQSTSGDLERLGVPHTDPHDLMLFDPVQFEDPEFPYVPFTEDASMDWVAGRDLICGGVRMVPADLVYMAGPPQEGRPIGYPTSNGLACGCTAEEATVGGILELVERDAFVTTWYNRLSLPLIDVQSDPELAEFVRRHLGHTGLDVSLVNLSVLVGVPTVLAVVRNAANGVAPLALGAASACDPVAACRKAVIEGFPTRGWAKAEQRDGSVIDPAGGFAQVRTFDDHVRLSLHPEAIAAAGFLDSSTERVSVSEIPAVPHGTPAGAIRALASLMQAQGVDLTAVDVTSPDVREGGMHVVKVFSAALGPLDAGYHQRFLGNRRMRQRAHELGLAPAPTGVDGLNPWPHPFP